MDYSAVDYQSILDLISSFFEYIKTEIFNNQFSGLLLHLFGVFPAEIRSFVIVSLCALLFIVIIINIKR